MSLEWKRVGVMDNESGDDETEELKGESQAQNMMEISSLIIKS